MKFRRVVKEKLTLMRNDQYQLLACVLLIS